MAMADVLGYWEENEEEEGRPGKGRRRGLVLCGVQRL
jgi:hypothetical protein